MSNDLQVSAFSTNPYASPASVIGYTLILYYALLYNFDACHRIVPSQYARHILDTSIFANFFEECLDLYVPSFCVYEFSQLATYFHPVASNLRFVSSLATSTLPLDFGRHIPASIFFRLHDLMASLPANTSTEGLLIEFYTSIVATITIGNNDVNLTPANYFGRFWLDGNNHAHGFQNWLATAVERLLTPNAIRPVFGTPTIVRLPMQTPPTIAPDAFQPYPYLTSLSIENEFNLLTITRSLSDWTKVTYPAAQPLRNYVTTGSSLPRHIVMKNPLPTHHTMATPNANALTTGTPPRLNYRQNTVDQLANAIHFLHPHPDPGANTTPTSVDLSAFHQETPPAANPAIPASLPFVVPDSTPPSDDPEMTRRFKSSRDYLPNCRIVTYDEIIPSAMGPLLTSGLIIESNGISMIGLPLVNTSEPLYASNTRLILGGIETSLVRSAYTAPNVPFVVRRTNAGSNYRLPQMYTHGPGYSLLLPLYREGLVTPAHPPAPTDHATVQNIRPFFPAVNFIRYARRALDGINMFSRPLGSTQSPIGPDGHLYVWSSYRHTDPESRRTYLLMTLDHLQGTAWQYATSRHPALRIL